MRVTIMTFQNLTSMNIYTQLYYVKFTSITLSTVDKNGK